ncbi:MAG: hypothetical protein II195_00015 [Selenomonadales bacterium]|nr:hypothetical protein [Selenomonadales bacterium]
MNIKATKLSAYFNQKEITGFRMHEAKDQMNTAVFHTGLQSEGKTLPMMVILDSSMFITIEVWIANKLVTPENRSKILPILDDMNSMQKLFRYFTREEDGGLFLSTCMMAKDDTSDPEVVHALMDITAQHVSNDVPDMMKRIAATAEQTVDQTI